MTRPFLLRANLPRFTPGQFRRATLFEFGELRDAELPSSSPEPPLHLCAEWRRAAAEELLLRAALGLGVPEAWLEEFADVSPFERPQIPLAEVIDKPAACAVFPLNTETADDRPERLPGLGRVWVVEGVDARPNVNGIESIPGRFGLGFVATEKEWSGRSWQLAGRLAARAVEEEADGDVKKKLACDWIATGRVEGDLLHRVTLGNKLSLRIQRKWLLPFDNYGDVPLSFNGELRVAADLDSAWNHILGHGFVQGGKLPWPEDVAEIHIIVGGNIKAAVASALFCPPETIVHLWHSENEQASGIPAAAARIVLKALRPELEIPSPRKLDSRNPAKAEQTLRTALADSPRDGTILFNVTSGNRLMSYAALAAARLYIQIRLVYRDIDAAPGVFSWLDYFQRPPVSGTFYGRIDHHLVHPVKNIDFLWNRAPYTGTRPEDIAADFLKKLEGDSTPY